MLNNEICNMQLFKDLNTYAVNMNMVVVDVIKHVHSTNDIQICIVVMKKEGDTLVSDLEAFHRTVQPALELIFKREALSMEVSTPGLQRTFRDYYEFTIFEGKSCRLYATSLTSWVEGVIGKSTEDGIELIDYKVVDSNENGKILNLKFSDIQKAKLDYKWSK